MDLFSLDKVLELIQDQGIDVEKFEESFVKNILSQRITQLKLSGFNDYSFYIKDNASEAQMFMASLNNNYSEFFRNPLSYSVLEKITLPEQVTEKSHSGREFRAWSVACASGQEPYTLAMLLEEVVNGRRTVPRYRIFATDKSAEQIKNARLGRYTSVNIGNVTSRRLEKWFFRSTSEGEDTHYVVKSILKQNIDFSVFDLLNDNTGVPPSSIFGSFDLVICANFLFYYKPYWRNLMLKKIIGSIAPDGLLMVSTTERELLNQKGFTEIFYRSGIFKV